MAAYLIESAFCLVCFYAFYHFVLRRETFFQWSRAYLLVTPLLAMVLPALNIRLDRIPEVRSVNSDATTGTFVERTSAATTNTFAERTSAILPLVEQVQSSPVALHRYDWSQPVAAGWSVSLADALWWIYGLGAVLLLGVLVLRFGRLFRMLRRCRRERQGTVTFATSEVEEVPLASFFGFVFWNKNAQLSESQRFLLEHELVHVRQRHSLDVLLMELMVVLQWFNPLMHTFRRSLCAVHEYIADDYVVRHTRQRRAYATLLVQQAAAGTRAPSGSGLVNTFHSLIKQRLIMLAKRPSRPLRRVKFALALPLAAGLMLLFSFRLVETLPAAAPLRSALESAANYVATLSEVTIAAEKPAAQILSEPEPTPYIFYWGHFQSTIYYNPDTDTYFGNAHLTPAEFRESVQREPRLWNGDAKTLQGAVSLTVRRLSIQSPQSDAAVSPEERAQVLEDFVRTAKPGTVVEFSNRVSIQSDYNRSEVYATTSKAIGDLAFEVKPGEFIALSDLLLPNGKTAKIDLVIDASQTGYSPRGTAQIQSNNSFYRISPNRPEHLAWGANVWETISVRDVLTVEDFWKMMKESPLYTMTGDTLPTADRQIFMNIPGPESLAIELKLTYNLQDLKASTEANWEQLTRQKEKIVPGTRVMLQAAPITTGQGGTTPEGLPEEIQKTLLTIASFEIVAGDNTLVMLKSGDRRRFTFEWGKFSRTIGMLYGTSVTDRTGERVPADAPFSQYTFEIGVPDVLTMLTQTPHLWKEDTPHKNLRFRVRYSDELKAEYDPAKGGLPADFVATLKSRLKPGETIVLEGFEADGVDLRNLSLFLVPHDGIQKPPLQTAASLPGRSALAVPPMTVSPNPATDRVNFRFTVPPTAAGSLHITNALGQEVYLLETDFGKLGGSFTLNTRDLKAKGTFYATLELPASQSKTTVTFVVQ